MRDSSFLRAISASRETEPMRWRTCLPAASGATWVSVSEKERRKAPWCDVVCAGVTLLRMGGPLAPTLFACGVYQPSVEQCEDSAKMDVWFLKFVAAYWKPGIPAIMDFL